MAEIVFGLHRRERIACRPFSEKVVAWTHFGAVLTSFRVPVGATWATFELKNNEVSQFASVSLLELWNRPETSRALNQVGGQSLSKRQVI